ncbi:MAG: ABC transporter substrate-binding protein [Firmicutes bacterium]|nr:ABC transporter substrate-binding protein [Bacillota bacterium]
MKKFFVLLLASLLLCCSLSGCSEGGSVSEKRTLSVFNWGEYIDMSVIEQFEEETGIDVVYSLYETNEEMYLKLSSGGSNYDVLFPSDYMIERLINEDRLAKINFDNVPNYELIGDQFKNLAYDPNNEYSVPYMWGTLGILYNTTMVDEEPDWDTLWDPQYAGNIIMSDSVRDTFTPALKRLGYSCNETDEAHLREALTSLIDQADLVYGYYVDQSKDQMATENAALALIYAGDAQTAIELNENLAFTIPTYSNLFFDAMVIPANAQNKDEAEEFINFMCRTDIAIKNLWEIWYSTPHEALTPYLDPEQTDAATLAEFLGWDEEEAQELLDCELLENEIMFPDPSAYEHCEVFLDLGEANALYDALWTEMKASIGGW